MESRGRACSDDLGSQPLEKGSSLLGQQVAQFANSLGDLRDRSAAKAQNKTLERRLAHIRRREGPDPEVLAAGAFRNIHIADPVPQGHGKMHTCLVPYDLNHGPELLADAVYQDIPSIAVQDPHSANVPRKMSFSYEISKHLLMEARRTEVHRTADDQKTIDQIRRYNHVPEAQRREQNLAE